jgi:lysophospholipase L1-like esterase
MLCFAAAAPASAGGCTVPADLVDLGAPLPKLFGALRTNSPIRIVALGSSSTWGAGASSRAHSYPARLERELRVTWPNNDVRVINAGVNGQLARDMVQRIDKDVAPHKPQLVAWQTGVNDAIKDVPLDAYVQLLRTGIERFRVLGADVVLIDQQFYPRFAKLKNGPLYMQAMREVALKLKVPVVQRYRIMQHLIASAQFTTATMLAPDQFHLNDQSYDCMGRLLAQSLRSAATFKAAPAAVAQPVRQHEAKM